MDRFEKLTDTKEQTEAGFNVAEIMREHESVETDLGKKQQDKPLDSVYSQDQTRKNRESISEETKSPDDNEEEESSVRIILDFLSTFFVALIVMIAGILVIGQLAGFHMFNVASGSMTPTYPVNSLVIVRDVDPETIETGDVITFVMNEDGMLVTHRVVSVDPNEKTFRTKGDANNVEDAEPVIWGNVVGKVMFGIPAIGGPFAVMTAKEHRKIMIGIILGLLLLSIWWDGNKKKRKNKEGEANE